MKPFLTYNSIYGVQSAKLQNMQSGKANVTGGITNAVPFPEGIFSSPPRLHSCFVLNSAGQNVGDVTAVDQSSITASGFTIIPFEDGICYWTASKQD